MEERLHPDDVSHFCVCGHDVEAHMSAPDHDFGLLEMHEYFTHCRVCRGICDGYAEKTFALAEGEL